MSIKPILIAVAVAIGSSGAIAADAGAPARQSEDQKTRSDVNQRATPVAPASPADPAYRKCDPNIDPSCNTTSSGDTELQNAPTTPEADVTRRPTPVAPATPADPKSPESMRR